MQRRLARSFALVLLAGLLLAPLWLQHAPPTRAAGLYSDMVVLRAGSGAAATFVTESATDYGATPNTLPLGLLDRADTMLYAVTTTADGSTLKVIDTMSGRTLRQMQLSGTFSTRSGDYAVGSVPLSSATPGTAATTSGLRSMPAGMVAAHLPSVMHAAPPADGSQVMSALSYNGRWLALRDTNSGTGSSTRIIVVDTAAMRIVLDTTLNGYFGLDALSADGRALYLIQSLPDKGYGYYQVRSYDVGRRALDPKPVLAPDETAGSMHGVAWTRQWSPNGSWLYTLYAQDDVHVFIHALNLSARQTRCIDFPPIRGAATAIAHFTLSGAPDGSALYAANPVLGLLAVVRNLPMGKVTFHRLSMHAGAPERTQTEAAISANGKTVFVATGSGVWAVDTHALSIRAVYSADQEVASVALSHDGSRLYMLSVTSQQLDSLDSATGSAIDGLQYSAGTWAIEGVAGGGSI